MGRGRAKAKQTKVARELKYRSFDTDFSSLERELRSGSEGHEVPPAYADLAEEYEERRSLGRRAGVRAPSQVRLRNRAQSPPTGNSLDRMSQNPQETPDQPKSPAEADPANPSEPDLEPFDVRPATTSLTPPQIRLIQRRRT